MRTFILLLFMMMPIWLCAQNEPAAPPPDSTEVKPEGYKVELGENTRADLLGLLRQKAEIDAQISRILTILVEARGIPFKRYNWGFLDEEMKTIAIVEKKE